MNACRYLTLLCCAAACFPVAAIGAALAIKADEDRGELIVSQEGRPVLAYAFAKTQIKPYVRELYAANGLNVLLDSPPDHLHHHGLMYAIRVAGVNFWEENGSPGHEVSVKLLSHGAGRTSGGLPEARFSQLIHWLDHTNAIRGNTAKSAALLIETRTIAVTIDGDEVAVDWTGEFEVVPPRVMLTGSAYNGLGLRFPEAFNHIATRQNSEKAPYTREATWDVLEGRWSAVSGKFGERTATAVLFANPANAGEARFFTMLNPFTYSSVTQNLEKRPLEYKAGDRFTVHYLLTVYPTSKTAAYLDERYTRWNKTIRTN